MGQLFPPSFNTIGRILPPAVVLLVGGSFWASMTYFRSQWSYQAGLVRNQPVPFSHEHHVRGLGLDCRYCHTSVETSPYAGIPPTKTCITCHSEIWRNAPMLQPVRESWRTDQPMHWIRVYNLPGYVYFNHSAHIQKGIGCSSCHGQIDLMPLTMQAGSLQMQWCLTCHREPERFVRPLEQVFNIDYQPPPDQIEQGRKLCKEYGILPPKLMESCSLCHR